MLKGAFLVLNLQIEHPAFHRGFLLLFFFMTLGLELSDAKVYAP